MVLHTVQHPLLTDRLPRAPAQLPHTDLAGGRARADRAATAGDQLLQVLGGGFTVTADED